MRCASLDGWRSAAASAPRWLRRWLFERGSMSARLRAHGGPLTVRRIDQGVRRMRCVAALPGDLRAHPATWQREVLLLVDGYAVLWAVSAAPARSLRGAWRDLHRLGERPLGDGLFGRADLRRGPIQVRRLAPAHPLLRRARRALDACAEHDPGAAERRPLHAVAGCWARRSALLRRDRALWVTEVFLPGALAPQRG